MDLLTDYTTDEEGDFYSLWFNNNLCPYMPLDERNTADGEWYTCQLLHNITACQY